MLLLIFIASVILTKISINHFSQWKEFNSSDLIVENKNNFMKNYCLEHWRIYEVDNQLCLKHWFDTKNKELFIK